MSEPNHNARTPDRPAIRASAMYSARDAGQWLGFGKNWKAIYDIPESDLPRCRVGPNRGRLRYWGADLICYAKGIPPVDVQSAMDEFRERLIRPGAGVRPLPGTKAEVQVL